MPDWGWGAAPWPLTCINEISLNTPSILVFKMKLLNTIYLNVEISLTFEKIRLGKIPHTSMLTTLLFGNNLLSTDENESIFKCVQQYIKQTNRFKWYSLFFPSWPLSLIFDSLQTVTKVCLMNVKMWVSTNLNNCVYVRFVLNERVFMFTSVTCNCKCIICVCVRVWKVNL
jgi:hypothetical protein